MGAIKKDILIGMLVAFFATFGGIYLYLEYFSRYEFNETLQFIKKGNLFGKVLSLAAVSNLFVFFVFIKKQQDNRAKGVLLATILIALTTVVFKII
ncbi:MAG: hypothetical protein P8P28_07760 [Polaribacter sp.]|jgi:hypothetical protein|nr:hypothetical protein [Polaribacter sp.]MDC1104422.1 hypothetical protein [Polaribacter sp.]MDC1374854.1 hypothetical protein [Polaribacter sp.]MDG1245308.1 hypothetical protein [Polaribacter sp.]MDG1321909.1 hypothetical protein [Polaribacter sp.]